MALATVLFYAERQIYSFLSIYAALVALATVISSIGVLVFMLGSLRASRKIHLMLVRAVLGTTFRYISIILQFKIVLCIFRWLDETPSSRVITRCTQDIRISKFQNLFYIRSNGR